MKIVSGFEVTGWDTLPYGEEGEGPILSEAHVVKRYHGDLDGEGRVRLLMCRASAEGPLENAGYLASERVSGDARWARGDVRAPSLGNCGSRRTAAHRRPRGAGVGDG